MSVLLRGARGVAARPGAGWNGEAEVIAYFDHAATTSLRAEASEAWLAAHGAVRGWVGARGGEVSGGGVGAVLGNPASIHADGQRAKALLESARARVAAALDAEPIGVVLTSGGTESVNLALKGLFWGRSDAAARRILVPASEHHASLDTVAWLAEAQGAEPELLAVDELGRVELDAASAALTAPGAAVLSCCVANTEVGTLQPVAALAAAAREAGVPVHLDAVGAVGAVPVSFRELGVDAMSVSAHKLGGPVGVGALLLSRRARLVPLVHGGGQQRFRSGTQDAAGAVAFAVALELAVAELPAEAARLARLRDRLAAGIRSRVVGAVERGDTAARLPGLAHFTFDGCDGESLLLLLDRAGFSVSTGSACQAGVAEPSHVLLAMGLSAADARGALRFSLGRTSTEAEVDALLAVLPEVVERARLAG